MTIINDEKNYWELKESIRMIKNQRIDTEKKYVLMKLLNEMKLLITFWSLKYKTISSSCLKCKKIQKT